MPENGPVPRSPCSAVQQKKRDKETVHKTSQLAKASSRFFRQEKSDTARPVVVRHRKVKRVRTPQESVRKALKQKTVPACCLPQAYQGFYTNRKLARLRSKESVDVSGTLAAIPKRARTRKGNREFRDRLAV